MTYPLLTERLSISPLTLSDLDSFVAYRSDPEVARFQSWDSGYSNQQGRQLIESQLGMQMPEPGQWLQLALHLRATGEHIGDLALHAIQVGAFEVGFTVARNHQGHGFASEAVARLIEFLVAEHGARKIVATTDVRNAKSIRLLKTFGFEADPSRRWTEELKGEIVEVDRYELAL